MDFLGPLAPWFLVVIAVLGALALGRGLAADSLRPSTQRRDRVFKFLAGLMIFGLFVAVLLPAKAVTTSLWRLNTWTSEELKVEAVARYCNYVPEPGPDGTRGPTIGWDCAAREVAHGLAGLGYTSFGIDNYIIVALPDGQGGFTAAPVTVWDPGIIGRDTVTVLHPKGDTSALTLKRTMDNNLARMWPVTFALILCLALAIFIYKPALHNRPDASPPIISRRPTSRSRIITILSLVVAVINSWPTLLGVLVNLLRLAFWNPVDAVLVSEHPICLYSKGVDSSARYQRLDCDDAHGKALLEKGGWRRAGTLTGGVFTFTDNKGVTQTAVIPHTAEDMSRYTIGDHVRLRYSPRHPDRAEISRTIFANLAWAGAFVLGSILTAILGILWIVWRASKRSKQAVAASA